jgi:hypothetical protein
VKPYGIKFQSLCKCWCCRSDRWHADKSRTRENRRWRKQEARDEYDMDFDCDCGCGLHSHKCVFEQDEWENWWAYQGFEPVQDEWIINEEKPPDQRSEGEGDLLESVGVLRGAGPIELGDLPLGQ